MNLSIRLYFCVQMGTMNLRDHLSHEVFRIIALVAEQAQTEAYVIGGFVRDLLIEGGSTSPKDIDVVVVGSGIDMAEKVRKSIGQELPLTVFKNFGTAMLKWGETEIEFVGARKESYRRDSRKPRPHHLPYWKRPIQNPPLYLQAQSLETEVRTCPP